jgi:hypothetical protein
MGKQTLLKTNDVISASEIGEFTYCSNSWLLHRRGFKAESPNIDAGKKFHHDLGTKIDSINKTEQTSGKIQIFGYVLLVVAIIIILLEVFL